MKNNSNDQSKSSKMSEIKCVKDDSRMRAQNRDILNEGKDLAKNPPSKNRSQKQDH